MDAALEKYNRIYYKNNTSPPINQANLNKIEEGITVNRDAIIALQEEYIDLPFSIVDGKLCVSYTKQ